jgi:hypothetical protein
VAEARLEEAALGRRERRARASKQRDPGLELRPRPAGVATIRVPPQGLFFELLFAPGAGSLDANLGDGGRRRQRFASQLFLTFGAHPLHCWLRSWERRCRGDPATRSALHHQIGGTVCFALVQVVRRHDPQTRLEDANLAQ